MTRTRKMYMHTIDGRLARWDGKRIVDAGDRPPPIPVYRTLRTLVEHTKKSWRKGDRHVYGWLEVLVPDARP